MHRNTTLREVQLLKGNTISAEALDDLNAILRSNCSVQSLKPDQTSEPFPKKAIPAFDDIYLERAREEEREQDAKLAVLCSSVCCAC